jgi:hypothetical protein
VHPQGDTGLQVRAIWAAHQAAKHGPQLFGTDVALDLDDEVVDVETVNLLFAGTDTFVIRRSVLPDETAAWAGDIVDMVDDAQELHGLSSPDLASAQPSGLCHEYCPFLHRCRRGQEHVAATAGPDALDARIGRR